MYSKPYPKRATVCDQCLFATRLYNKSLKIDFCDLTSQLTCNYNFLGGGHRDETGHHKMAVLGMAGDHGDDP